MSCSGSVLDELPESSALVLKLEVANQPGGEQRWRMLCPALGSLSQRLLMHRSVLLPGRPRRRSGTGLQPAATLVNVLEQLQPGRVVAKPQTARDALAILAKPLLLEARRRRQQ